MLVAKLPGSTYATAATKAGPRNGRRARRPRVSPFSALSAALRTRSSPGRAVGAGSMATQRSGCSTRRRASARTFNVCLYVNAASEAQRDAHAPAFDAALDRRLELAHEQNLDSGAGHEAAALELAQECGVFVGHALHAHLLPRPAVAQGPVAQRAHLAGEAWDGVPVRVQLRPAEQLEDSSLHPLRDHVLESLGLVVDLVPGVAQHLDQEHLEQAVVADELEGDLPAFLGELLAAVPVVLDQALCGEPRDHLAYRRGRDAQPLRQLSCRHRPLVAAQQVEGLEIVLLGAGECAAALEGDHLGMPTMKYS